MMKTKDIYMYLLGTVIVVGYFLILAVVFKTALPSENRDLGMLIIGGLVAKFGDVVSYFFGSSKGSADKTDIIKTQNQERNAR